MSFPEANFWVVVGTAAPVIAVAAVVQLSDVTGTASRLDQLTADAGEAWPSIRGWSTILLLAAFLVSLGNLLLQALTMGLALTSLMNSANAMSPSVGYATVGIGVFVLAVTAALNAALIGSRRGIEAALRARAERPAETHLHVHGVTADDLAALLARQRPLGGQQTR